MSEDPTSTESPSIKMLHYALERASAEYATTGSLYAKQRALELIKEMRQGLDDTEKLILSLDPAFNTGNREVRG